MASGAQGLTATVTSITDTGQLIDFNPVVVLAATLPDGQHVTLQTPVSKIEIPRAGGLRLRRDDAADLLRPALSR